MANGRKLFSVEMKIGATAYIRAKSQAEAMRIAKGLKHASLDFEMGVGDVEISGRQYDDPDIPDVSLSPAMTIQGPWGTHPGYAQIADGD